MLKCPCVFRLPHYTFIRLDLISFSPQSVRNKRSSKVYFGNAIYLRDTEFKNMWINRVGLWLDWDWMLGWEEGGLVCDWYFKDRNGMKIDVLHGYFEGNYPIIFLRTYGLTRTGVSLHLELLNSLRIQFFYIEVLLHKYTFCNRLFHSLISINPLKHWLWRTDFKGEAIRT